MDVQPAHEEAARAVGALFPAGNCLEPAHPPRVPKHIRESRELPVPFSSKQGFSCGSENRIRGRV